MPFRRSQIEGIMLSKFPTDWVWVLNHCTAGWKSITNHQGTSLRHRAGQRNPPVEGKANTITSIAGIEARTGYKRRPGSYSGGPAVVAPNQLEQVFKSVSPDQVWSQISHIKTHEGWLYLSIVIDLYFRHVVGWSIQSRIQMDLVLSSVLMTVIVFLAIGRIFDMSERHATLIVLRVLWRRIIWPIFLR